MRKSQATIWVNHLDYRWASVRWADRDVCVDTYLRPGYIRITKPGYSRNSKRKRLIRVDNETFQRETERALASIQSARYVPKRKS